MGSKYNDPRNAMQIFKQHGKNSFLEILGPTPEFTKVTFHFVKYDERSKKITEEASHYVSIPDTLVLCHHVETGILIKNSEICRKDNKTVNLWYRQGGTPSARTGGEAVARVLSVIPASKSQGVVFKSEVGIGREDKSGLIALDYKKPVNRILIPMPYETLYGMGAYTKMRLQSYTDWMQSNGFYGTFTGSVPDNTVKEEETAAEETKAAEKETAPEEIPEEVWENMSFIY